MEPLSAIAVAAAVLQFVELCSKIVSEALRIYPSGDASLDKNHELELVTNDLLVLQTKLDLTAQQSEDGHLNDDQAAFKRLNIAANQLTKALLARLNAVKAQGRFRRWKSFRQAIKSITSQRD